ncbi:LysM peptidoglycan-binding domain-containing protein [Bosea caraganae]|uniref:LysM peptidoglycan-binding domain-containing protein n=1 Tax=Bosea caraganae TaxID=2763117 RepID=A0A370LCU8_9HYPH|nr:peptidoglycan DD-metalloendopeptidase family protein [Bosea caraganae]RDJ27636.1 LysM peptidoglycan-binding domain-containing protein [Bosea caraganae]RDJ29650.1 LysM peptidoglycan-binding domain-containing protein [Bosea caraganae]
MRFTDTPFDNPFRTAQAPAQRDPVTTGSIGRVDSAPLAPSRPIASVRSQPLPPPQSAVALRTAPPSVTPVTGSSNGWSAQGGTPIVVAQGETLDILSSRYGVPRSALISANGLSGGSVAPGSRLIIPVYNAGGGSQLRAEAPVVEAPRMAVEAPRLEAPRLEAPRLEAPRLEAPRVAVQAPRVAVQAPRVEAPRVVATAPRLAPVAEVKSKAQIVAEARARAAEEQAQSKARTTEAAAHAKAKLAEEQAQAKAKAAADAQAMRDSRAKFAAEAKAKADAKKGVVAKPAPVDTRQVIETKGVFEARPTAVAEVKKPAPAPVPEKAKPVVVASAPPEQKVTAVPKSEPVAEPATTASLPKQEDAAASADFRWPARGRVIAGYGGKGSNEGINIAVPEGTPVKAAEGGVVAYAGSELKGYGNLVLIRHPNGYVSAYAHNGELNVKRGETVKRGQVVAKSGQSGNVASPQLHFELRKGSTPVDPVPYLNN